MKKRIVSCLIICVVIVLAYLYAYVDKNSYVYNKNADPSTFYSTGILTEGQEVAQSFVSKEDTIDGFNITNTHIVGTTSVTGKKTWKDANGSCTVSCSNISLAD